MPLAIPKFKPQTDAQILAEFLAEDVAPVAHRIDTDPAVLFEMFKEASDLGLLTPKTPDDFEGGGLSAKGYRQLQCEIARHSGALAFLLTQHQSAASFLFSGDNKTLKKNYLPKMASGERRVGVGFSHLRRVHPPVIARRVPGGYRLCGEVPWVTGAGLFEEFVGAAVIAPGEQDEGAAVFGLLPLMNCQGMSCQGIGDPGIRKPGIRHPGIRNPGIQNPAINGPDINGPDINGPDINGPDINGPGISNALLVDEPMALSGMSATRTVRVQLLDWFLADEWVIGTRPAGWLAARDRANPLSPIGLIQGCTEAAQSIMTKSLQRRQIKHDIEQQLAVQALELFAQTADRIALPVEAYGQKVAFRGQAIALMNTCAQAAMIAASGAANALHHPARRVQGEALVFSVSGQSTDGAIASLNSLMNQ